MKSRHKKHILENIHRRSAAELARELGLQEDKVRAFVLRQTGPAAAVSLTSVHGALLKNKALLAAFLAVALLGLFAYANSFVNPLIFDDHALIRDNAYIKDGVHLGKLLTQNIYAGAGLKTPVYRPLLMVTYMVDHAIWKLRPFGYHLTSVLLHVLAAGAVVGFIYVLFSDLKLSLLTGLFFVVHPVHTEAVTYISGRSDPLSLLFLLLAFIAYVRQPPRAGLKDLVVLGICYAAALFSRELTVILPFLFLLYHAVFQVRLKTRGFCLVLGLAVCFLILRGSLLKDLLDKVVVPSALWQRLPGFFVAFGRYLRLLVWPADLHMEYGMPLFSLSDLRALGGLFLLAAWAAGLWVARRKRDPVLVFSASWFLLALAPVSNLYPLNAFMAEHWLYLPSIGFFLALSYGFRQALRLRRARAVAYAVLGMLLAFYFYLTVRQNATWRDPRQFYERLLRYAPTSSRALYVMGEMEFEEERFPEAQGFYARSLESDPGYAPAYCGLGNVYQKLEDLPQAASFYREAIARKPDYPQAYNNLANVYQRLGETEKAAAAYAQAVKLDPVNAQFLFNQGQAKEHVGDLREAAKFYEKAVEADPSFGRAHGRLGDVYRKAEDFNKAAASYERAVKADPTNMDAYNNLAGTYFRLGRDAEAVSTLEKAILAEPSFVPAYVNLSTAFYRRKDYRAAIRYCDQAVALGAEIDPQYLKMLEPHRK